MQQAQRRVIRIPCVVMTRIVHGRSRETHKGLLERFGTPRAHVWARSPLALTPWVLVRREDGAAGQSSPHVQWASRAEEVSARELYELKMAAHSHPALSSAQEAPLCDDRYGSRVLFLGVMYRASCHGADAKPRPSTSFTTFWSRSSHGNAYSSHIATVCLRQRTPERNVW